MIRREVLTGGGVWIKTVHNLYAFQEGQFNFVYWEKAMNSIPSRSKDSLSLYIRSTTIVREITPKIMTDDHWDKLSNNSEIITKPIGSVIAKSGEILSSILFLRFGKCSLVKVFFLLFFILLFLLYYY